MVHYHTITVKKKKILSSGIFAGRQPLDPGDRAQNQPKPHPSNKTRRRCLNFSERLKGSVPRDPSLKAFEAAEALTL